MFIINELWWIFDWSHWKLWLKIQLWVKFNYFTHYYFECFLDCYYFFLPALMISWLESMKIMIIIFTLICWYCQDKLIFSSSCTIQLFLDLGYWKIFWIYKSIRIFLMMEVWIKFSWLTEWKYEKSIYGLWLFSLEARFIFRKFVMPTKFSWYLIQWSLSFSFLWTLASTRASF